MVSNLKNEQDIIAKFNVKNEPLYTKLLWRDDEKDLFHVKIFYENNTWTGIYSKESAANRVLKLDETKDEYHVNVKNCLSGNCNNYIFDFTKSPDNMNLATFTWKKKYEGAVKIHGVVNLTQDEVPVPKDMLIDILLEENNNLKIKIKLAKETNNNLSQNLEQYKERLKELTESKLLLESTLYGRFVQVLNEKKKRIQLLEESVKSFKNI